MDLVEALGEHPEVLSSIQALAERIGAVMAVAELGRTRDPAIRLGTIPRTSMRDTLQGEKLGFPV